MYEKSGLTQAKLKRILHYNQITGDWTWISHTNSSSRVEIGSKAGTIQKRGYRYINISGKKYLSSRLAFLYMLGFFPENDVDHKNRVRDDDRWDNLRHVSRQCNTRNQGVRCTNKSGVTGVSFNKDVGVWCAYITISGKKIHLLGSKNKKEAIEARWKAEKKYNFPRCNTLSSASAYIKSKILLEKNEEAICV